MTDETNDPSAPTGGEGGETAAVPDPMGAPRMLTLGMPMSV
jgi:hypothetical protein